MPDQLGNVVNIERLRYGLTQRVGPQFAASLRAETARDYITEDIIVRLSGDLLAETLPPLKLIDSTAFTVPRFATWFDHFAATYRSRWWAWPLRRHVVRYVDEPHTHRTEVAVRNHWTYPRATRVLPGRDFGHVVLKSEAWNDGNVTPW
jgi:hypothetical protein